APPLGAVLMLQGVWGPYILQASMSLLAFARLTSGSCLTMGDSADRDEATFLFGVLWGLWLGPSIPSIRVRASSQATRRVWRRGGAAVFLAWPRRILMHARIAHQG